MNRYNLDVATRLMLTQGISLIEDGMQFLEWMNGVPNENTRDALNILRDRFEYFKECALEDGKCDTFIIDRATLKVDEVQFAFKLREKVKEELEGLRKQAISERVNFEKRSREKQ